METITVIDLRLAYQRTGKGLPLLLIHGFPLDHDFWNPLASHLKNYFDMIMPDLPGFGSSDVPNGEHTIDEMAADLLALLDRLKIQQTYLAGHSMGGYVSLAFARAYPERVLGLSLISSQAAPDDFERKAARLAQAGQVALHGPLELVGMAQKLSANPDLEPFFREMIMRQRADGLINGLKAMASRPDAANYLERFTFPAAFIHGQADALIPVERAREMKNLMPQAELTEMPGVGHSPAVEAPMETARLLLKLSGRER